MNPHLGLPVAAAIQRAASSLDLTICYLGQVGFLLQKNGLNILIDPYLTDSVDRLEGQPKDFWVRNYPPPVRPDELNEIDLVLCTHEHLDHTDPETLCAIASASPHGRFAGPAVSVATLTRAGIDPARLSLVDEDIPLEFKGVQVEPIAAAHEEYQQDAEGHHLYLSYLLRWDGLTLFHAGDTLVTPELRARLARETVDVAFLPVNGRSPEKLKLGVLGNMNVTEAAELAAALQFDLLIPTHFDLYPNNGALLADFAHAWESRPMVMRPKLKVFRPAEKIVYRKADRRRELAVIIGAGKTGRGFLARLLAASDYDIAFIDRDENLVRLLNEAGRYSIHFFGGGRPSFTIDGVLAAPAASPQALEWMTRSSLLLTAVGESNIASLVPDLRQVLDERRRLALPQAQILVCENGASPAAPLRAAFADRPNDIAIGEAAIFCSTIELPGTRLDVQSEPYDELPYDARLYGLLPFPALRKIPDFPVLLRRKIYTYNCLSACIAYLGAYKHYQWYADAANDPEIGSILDQLAEPLNRAIAQTFKVDPAGQKAFFGAALEKFRNQDIRDDIPRNARHVARKLAPHDRLMEPARLILATGAKIDPLALVMAAALLYRGPDEKALQEKLKSTPVQQVFAEISGCEKTDALAVLVGNFYAELSGTNPPSLTECLAKSRAGGQRG